MGQIQFGIPEKEMLFLKKKMGSNVLFEGGTYTGGTALLASKFFEKVYTVEKSEVMYKKAKKRIEHSNKIKLLKGDTRDFLSTVLEKHDNILFWLDAHWSGGETYGKDDECPLIDELTTIFSYKKTSVILVDDARLFMAPPPKPHVVENWPSLRHIVAVLPPEWGIYIHNDVMYLIPEPMKKDFEVFLQYQITYDSSSKRSGAYRLSELRSILSKLTNKL